MRGHTERGYKRPIPNFPEPRPKQHKRSRRTREKLPKPENEHMLPVVEYDTLRGMTSSAKGRGREQCMAEGQHVWVRVRWRVMHGHIVTCCRCGAHEWNR